MLPARVRDRLVVPRRALAPPYPLCYRHLSDKLSISHFMHFGEKHDRENHVLEASRTSPPRPDRLTDTEDRCTSTPSVLHDTRRHQADTCPELRRRLSELRRGLSEDTENYQADSEIITRAWLGYAASGTRPSPPSHNAIRDRHAPQRKLVLPPSHFPTRADLTTVLHQ